ncbi:MAG: hypothetical protein RL213_1199 [Bacteroidota bacterium]|jgi:uncharacterized membrane protein
MNKDLAQVMLNTAANLLGFCLIVITTLRMKDVEEARFVDKLMMLVTLLLAVSCVLSFAVLHRTDNRLKRLYSWAGYFFMASLVGILVSISLIAFYYL